MSIKVECDKCGQEVDGVYVAVLRFWGAVPLALAARPESAAFDEDFHVCNDCLAMVLETLSGDTRDESLVEFIEQEGRKRDTND